MDKYHFDIFLNDNGHVPDKGIALDVIGHRKRHEMLNYILTRGLIVNEGTILETVFPVHRISHILITNSSKLSEKE